MDTTNTRIWGLDKMTDIVEVVKMVIYQCRELGNPVTETLAAYVA